MLDCSVELGTFCMQSIKTIWGLSLCERYKHTSNDRLKINFKNLITFTLKCGNIILSDNSEQYYIQTVLNDSGQDISSRYSDAGPSKHN